MASVKIGREDFISRLQAIQPGLSVREILEQSSCVVAKDGMLLSFNDEIGCRYPSGLPKDFTGAVKAKTLTDQLGKWQEDDIELETTDAELIVRGKKKEARFTLEREILLAISAIEKPGAWREVPAEFTDAVDLAANCAGKDQSQFELTCVHLHPDWIEACDNSQFVRYNLATGLARATLVRRESIKHILSFGMTELAESDGWLHFRNPNKLILSCRRYQEEYHDMTAVLNDTDTYHAATLPKGLTEAVGRCQVFSGENADNDYVKVELRPGKIRINGTGVSGSFWEVKDMPSYKGRPLAFLIAPQLLGEIVKRHNDVLVSATKIKVDGGKWIYMASLGPVNDAATKPGKAAKRQRAEQPEAEPEPAGVDE